MVHLYDIHLDPEEEDLCQDTGALGGSYDDEVACITLVDITTQREWVHSCLCTLREDSPTRHSLFMMLSTIDDMLSLYKKVGPLSDIRCFTCQRRRRDVMGPHKWDDVKVATRGHAVKGTVFDIPLDRPADQPLRLKKFKREAATPYVYDRFIGAWGMFPHHDQVPLYFEKHIYVDFVLDMHPNYTIT